MDPNACLEELIDLAKDVLKQYDKDKLPANSLSDKNVGLA